jgi:Xaa-Pro dipeptidase
MVWEKVDSILIANFKQYWKHPLVNKYLITKENLTPSESFEGMLLLRKNKKPIWISHPFNITQAKETFLAATVKTYQTRADLQKILKKNCGKRIGFDSRHTAVSTLTSFRKLIKGKFISVSKELEAMREIKEEIEIDKIKKAVKETRRVLDKIKAEIKEGVSEKEVYFTIKEEFEKNGFDLGFCIVAFGKNTANIHHNSTDKKLEFNSPIMIDVGAKYCGYFADLTDTFWFGDREPKDFRETKKKVEMVLANVESKLKVGTRAKELWKETTPLGKMPHALGHGLGLEEHDFPGGIGENTNWKIKNGMILAIEPGIYSKEFGIRLEKDYLILKKGFETL